MDPWCPLCGEQVEESPSHLFLGCHWTRQTWFSSGLAIRTGDVTSDVVGWLLQLKEQLSFDLMDQVAMICWSIWKCRNESIFNKVKPDSRRAIMLADSMRLDWLSHQEKKGSAATRTSEPVWTPPPAGSMKMNFDAGWAGATGMGLGLVVRDSLGAFQVAATHYQEVRMDPLMAEAVGLRWALNLATNWNLDSLVVSSDCQQLVKAFHSPIEYPSLKNILLDCLQLIDSFSSFSLLFEYRQTNRVAHALAAESHLYKDCEWWGNPPVGILLHLAADFPN